MSGCIAGFQIICPYRQRTVQHDSGRIGSEFALVVVIYAVRILALVDSICMDIAFHIKFRICGADMFRFIVPVGIHEIVPVF